MMEVRAGILLIQKGNLDKELGTTPGFMPIHRMKT